MSDPTPPPPKPDPMIPFESLLKKLVAVPKKELDEKVKAFKGRKRKAKL
jgi:hypothetical protein